MTHDPRARCDHPARAWLAGVAAILIGVGAAIVYPVVALVFVLTATCFSAAAVWLGARHLRAVGLGERSVRRLMAAGIVVMWMTGMIGAAILEPAFVVAFTVASAAGLLGVLRTGAHARALSLWAIGVHTALMLWMLAVVPAAANQDVDLFPRDASAALLRGENPYAITFENIYGPGTPLYAPEVQVEGRLDVGYPYPPVSLFVALAGELIAGDHRYAAAIAVGLTGILILGLRPDAIGRGAGVLVASSPIAYRVVYNGWSEPVVGLLFVLTLLLAVRNPKAAPIALGLLVVSKQYAAPMIAIALVLMKRTREAIGWLRVLIVSGAVALATVVPFVVWDAGRFYRSVVEFHLLQPLRSDAISIPGLLVRLEVAALPAWVGFVVAALVLGAVLRWAPRTAAGFAIGSGTLYLAFFVTSKQAFMNYYYVVFVALACGVAAMTRVAGGADATQTDQYRPALGTSDHGST